MDEITQIKERIDIVDIISSYLTLKKAGSNLKANCPFHGEKTPSFMVSPERQTFKCFGCGEGGDVFTFIEKMEGLDFYNAMKLLADKAGVQLKQSVQYNQKEFKSDRKTRVYEVNDWAKKLFHKILIEHPKAEKARQYLTTRGMSDKSIEEFEIGYAPNSWDLLIKFLKNKGFTPEEIFQAGVTIKSNKGDYYDRFRGRIMFPINNIMGATIAFTSRIIEDDPKQAKYINSSESPIYTKGKTIYGLDKAKVEIKSTGVAVFVEGNMDVITCHQAGFKNVIATSGTALTEDQIKIISRYTPQIAFCFDTDKAGEAAMKKAVKLALKNDINSKIVAIPSPYKDPDEAIKADSKNWQKAVESSKPSLEYWIDLLVRKTPELSVEDRKNIAKEILPVIKSAFSDIEKEYYIKYLSKKISVTEKALVSSLEKTKVDQDLSQSGEKKAEPQDTKYSMEEKLLGMIWYDNAIYQKNKGQIKDKIIFSPKYDDLIKLFGHDGFHREELKDDQMAMFLDQLVLKILEEYGDDKESLVNEANFLISRMRSDQREGIREEFATKIREAEDKGDKGEVKRLLAEFATLIK